MVRGLLYWINGRLNGGAHQGLFKNGKKGGQTHIPNSLGREASSAPNRVTSHMLSHMGKGILVTWLRIIRPTWWANWRPHEEMKGRKRGEWRRGDGAVLDWDSQSKWTNVGKRKGRRRRRGCRIDPRPSAQ